MSFTEKPLNASLALNMDQLPFPSCDRLESIGLRPFLSPRASRPRAVGLATDHEGLDLQPLNASGLDGECADGECAHRHRSQRERTHARQHEGRTDPRERDARLWSPCTDDGSPVHPVLALQNAWGPVSLAQLLQPAARPS